MSSRQERIQAEAVALWRELYDEPPPTDIDEMLELMLRRLPSVTYERLNSPYLRRGLSWPKSRPAA